MTGISLQDETEPDSPSARLLQHPCTTAADSSLLLYFMLHPCTTAAVSSLLFFFMQHPCTTAADSSLSSYFMRDQTAVPISLRERRGAFRGVWRSSASCPHTCARRRYAGRGGHWRHLPHRRCRSQRPGCRSSLTVCNSSGVVSVRIATNSSPPARKISCRWNTSRMADAASLSS